MLNAVLRAVVAILLISPASTAATPAQSPAPASTCAAIADPMERLACHDAAHPPIVAGARPLTRGQGTAGEPDTRHFGLSGSMLAAQGLDCTCDRAPEQIGAVVTDLSYRSAGQRVITLDNGQVWMQTESSGLGHVAVGDRVVVRKAALGSFLLITPARVSLRVRRID